MEENNNQPVKKKAGRKPKPKDELLERQWLYVQAKTVKKHGGWDKLLKKVRAFLGEK